MNKFRNPDYRDFFQRRKRFKRFQNQPMYKQRIGLIKLRKRVQSIFRKNPQYLKIYAHQDRT